MAKSREDKGDRERDTRGERSAAAKGEDEAEQPEGEPAPAGDPEGE